MPIELYPSIAKIKRNGVYENLPGFVPETGAVATQQMIANAESSATAQYVHNKGEYFRLNDTLYQAIIKINIGDSIVVGTNCEVAVLGNDVTHISNSIADYELGIATAPHATGEYFMVGETMYVATADIDTGDNISTSTNCRIAVVGDELSELYEAIEQTDKVFDTVTAMISDTSLAVGNNVKTNGYNTVYDGGGAYYKISTTADRACSIQLANNLYAVLIGNAHNTRQLGIVANDKAQDKINAYIADTSFIALTVLDPIVLKKSASGTAIDVIELIKIRRDNFTLAFDGAGKFTLETLGEDYYRMIAIRADNITIVNPTLVGDADTIGITTGEYGHGLYITDTSKDITVYNGNISKCFGDAVGITTGTSNITFIGTLYCSYCGRQGISVTGVDGLYIDTIVGKYIQRTSPSAVIDFEPNDADSPINAYVKQIVAIDCKRGFLVAGNSAKSIFVDNVYAKHSSNDYWSDFEVNGTTLFSTNPVIQVVCNNIVVENAYKTVASFSNMNSNASVKCGNIIVNGMSKASSNSTAEATVYFNKGAKNVDLNIKVRNNTSANPNLGICCSTANETFENVHIVTEDDCSQIVTDSLNNATLINSTVINKPQSNSIQYINSSEITIERTNDINYQLRSFGNYMTVLNLKVTAFVLYRSTLANYSLVDPDNVVTESETYWTIPNTVKIASFSFNNTAKTVTVRKFA